MGNSTSGGRGRRRAWARTASVGAVVLVAGLVPGTGTGVAVDEGAVPVEADFGYRCALPGGEHPAEVGVSATLPRQVAAGRPVRPADVRVAVSLPAPAVAELAGRGAATVSGAVRLTGRVAQGDDTAELPWSRLVAPDAALPATGPLTVRGAGPVPTVTASSGGDLTFSTGPVALDLLLRKGDDTPTAPPGLTVTCEPEPDQDLAIGRVAVLPVPGGSPRPPAVEEPGAPGVPGQNGDQDGDQDGADGGQDGPASKTPGQGAGKGPRRPAGRADDCVEAPPVAQDPVPSHGYLAGYANVLKLGSALFIKDPGLMKVNMAKATQTYQCPRDDGLVFTMYSDATFDHKGKPQLPPVSSTFLTFGFMPTTAVAELTLDAPMEIATGSYFSPDGQFSEVTEGTAKLWIRLRDVKVNGTPLDVGPACRTARPVELTLTGRGSYDAEGRPHGYTVVTGGPLTGAAVIPEFSGCGVTEDLDPLFTASLSGSGNYTKMTQGVLCSPGQPEFCPDPPEPKPER
ncbi:DUF6801 domain-containing protein [Streptomyces ficellus]|uniref:DUF6801 domain-containing protein n=1 Tax=Streptomyces ficellus TaxID=1977088 RepID=A0A6I6F130_9ACTN|nr:DUF6801 domain-containing protein [Streptomyces ficellus]QGV77633.1 hypothetical protein EIZ62_04760 [Streptomyces ficellus]